MLSKRHRTCKMLFVNRQSHIYHVSAIYCPSCFFSSQKALASSRLRFPFATATSMRAASTPSPIQSIDNEPHEVRLCSDLILHVFRFALPALDDLLHLIFMHSPVSGIKL